MKERTGIYHRRGGGGLKRLGIGHNGKNEKRHHQFYLHKHQYPSLYMNENAHEYDVVQIREIFSFVCTQHLWKLHALKRAYT